MNLKKMLFKDIRKTFGILFLIFGIVSLPNVVAPGEDVMEMLGHIFGLSLFSFIPAFFLLRKSKKKNVTNSNDAGVCKMSTKPESKKNTLKVILSSFGMLFLCILIGVQAMAVALKPTYERMKERSEFAKQLELADKDCPMPVALGKGQVTGIKLKDNYVVYYCKYGKDSDNWMSYLDNDDKVKDALLSCFLLVDGQGNNQGSRSLDLLIRLDLGLKFVITESSTGYHEFEVPVNDIKRFRQAYQLNPHEALNRILSLFVESQNSALPLQIDEGMTLTDFKLDENNIVINCELDESLYSISAMRSNKTLLKSSFIEGCLNDPELKSCFDLCKVSHTGLIFSYVGNSSHDKCVITIPAEEICAITQTPSNVNIH